MEEAERIWETQRYERAARLGADRFHCYRRPASKLCFNVTDACEKAFPQSDGSLWRDGEFARAPVVFFLCC